MSLIKEIVKNILPASLREILAMFLQQKELVRRNAQIVEKNRRKIGELLSSDIPIKLEFGAGENRGICGWTYVDVNDNCDLTLDLKQSLPFPDNSVAMIYSSHLLEHFNYKNLLSFLKECLRILKPGGIFSAAVPNAKIYLDAYQTPEGFDPGIFCRHEPAFNYNSKIDYVNYMAYMDGHHKYMFDEENVLIILKKCGFINVRLREFDEMTDLEVRRFQTIYVNGKK